MQGTYCDTRDPLHRLRAAQGVSCRRLIHFRRSSPLRGEGFDVGRVGMVLGSRLRRKPLRQSRRRIGLRTPQPHRGPRRTPQHRAGDTPEALRRGLRAVLDAQTRRQAQPAGPSQSDRLTGSRRSTGARRFTMNKITHSSVERAARRGGLHVSGCAAIGSSAGRNGTTPELLPFWSAAYDLTRERGREGRVDDRRPRRAAGRREAVRPTAAPRFIDATTPEVQSHLG